MAAKALVPLSDGKVIKETVEQSKTQPTGWTSSVGDGLKSPEHGPLS